LDFAYIFYSIVLFGGEDEKGIAGGGIVGGRDSGTGTE